MTWIEKNGASFLVTLSTDNGTMGTFPGSYQDGILKTGNPMIGDIAHSTAQNAIFISGTAFLKTSENAEVERNNQLTAAAAAQEQARRAEQEAAERQYAERHRLELIGIHLTNCWNNNVQCGDLAAEARAYPGDVENTKREFFSRNRLTSADIAERESRFGPLPGSR